MDKVTDLGASGKWIHPILPQEKFNFSSHIFVVNGLAFLKVYSAPGLRRWFVVPGLSKLCKNAFLRQNTVQHTASLLNVAIRNEDRSAYELSVS